jgi:hypothetical protein
MAYTVDKAMLRMRGTYWCQQTRQTTMVADHQRPFIEHIKEALSLYIATNDQFPEHLIVFRAGISEGEFQRVGADQDNGLMELFTIFCRFPSGRAKPFARLSRRWPSSTAASSRPRPSQLLFASGDPTTGYAGNQQGISPWINPQFLIR